MGLRKISLISGILILAAALFISWNIHSGHYFSTTAQTGNKMLRKDDSVRGEKSGVQAGPAGTASSLRIIAVGDILLGRGVSSRIKRLNKTYASAFEDVVDILKKGDVVFGNLEEPITDRTRCLASHTEGGKFIIKNPVESFEALRFAGFNLFNLASNHTLDYYEEGLRDTIAILDRNGIVHAGAGENLDQARKAGIIEKNGLTIGLLGYTDWAELLFKGDPGITFAATADKPGVAPMNMELIKEDIRNLRNKVDVLIISLHWGVEGSSRPTPDQVVFAHELIDSGADIILGHHPHRFQGIELYRDKPIVYSLGNFLFDQNDPLSRESFIVDIELEKGKLKRLSAVPVTIADKIRVVRTTGPEASIQLNRLISLSGKLNSTGTLGKDCVVFGTSRPSSVSGVAQIEIK